MQRQRGRVAIHQIHAFPASAPDQAGLSVIEGRPLPGATGELTAGEGS
jgi:hypothetical protein